MGGRGGTGCYGYSVGGGLCGSLWVNPVGFLGRSSRAVFKPSAEYLLCVKPSQGA